jgi:hypothetical protein
VEVADLWRGSLANGRAGAVFRSIENNRV